MFFKISLKYSFMMFSFKKILNKNLMFKFLLKKKLYINIINIYFIIISKYVQTSKDGWSTSEKSKNKIKYSFRPTPTRFFTISFLGCPLQFFTFQNLPKIVNGFHHFLTFPSFSHYFYPRYLIFIH